MELKMFLRDVLPCWYELGYLLKPSPTLAIRIHKDFIRTNPGILADAPIILDLKNKFRLDTFERSFDGNFGFGGILKLKKGSGDFSEFRIALPSFRFFTEKEWMFVWVGHSPIQRSDTPIPIFFVR